MKNFKAEVFREFYSLINREKSDEKNKKLPRRQFWSFTFSPKRTYNPRNI
jgi:hypothetical protein